MASPTEVKTYLAHWFQLGKAVKSDHDKTRYQPSKVIQGDRFSAEFETCWDSIIAAKGEALYLEGTDQTIAELLSPQWDVVNCSRCEMPVPIAPIRVEAHLCPCNDLDSWPNEEIPRPRLPVNNLEQLGQVVERLKRS